MLSMSPQDNQVDFALCSDIISSPHVVMPSTSPYFRSDLARIKVAKFYAEPTNALISSKQPAKPGRHGCRTGEEMQITAEQFDFGLRQSFREKRA